MDLQQLLASAAQSSTSSNDDEEAANSSNNSQAESEGGQPGNARVAQFKRKGIQGSRGVAENRALRSIQVSSKV